MKTRFGTRPPTLYLSNLRVRPALKLKRYALLVSISAPWEALFAPDAQLRHGFGEALAEYEALVPTYRRHGYAIVFIPPLPVMERVASVLATVTAHEVAAV